ncbi:phosphoadenosine phosphosulfate reductase [Coniochaeta ligniaria NRRL 30616]|uniref:FAD synthase n=1 Tax=Coniochaeta ligniaria NRRL 30616 TaxID=1408157 RepID=A0A1J7IMU6_9PEZI|nr:phosphoadenosine phosphosulfate reductase [Coniochaeta ligniaria NRRL 30616]
MTLEPPSDQAGAGPATAASGWAPEIPPSHPSGRTLPDICHTLRRKLDAFLDEQTEDEVLRNVQSQARVSVGVISEALQRYGPEEISLSYNGGKDCLVLLILIMACLAGPATSSTSANGSTEERRPHRSTGPAVSSPATLQAIYIAPHDPFPEVEDFVETSTLQYHLDLRRYSVPMRSALEAYILDRPDVKAIFMGTRRTDPHCESLTHFSPTDKDWPQFMRVNPVIDWHYVEIWAFIRHLDIPFCSLYQQGFSSLGGMTNTRPNPALAIDASAKRFRPAYELVRDDEERLGRDR